jgi:type II restriction/modification system DNA methylase subunit YeeA
VPAEADLVAYFFEKARTQVERGECRRAGLLATQGIRGGANREVLKRIKKTGDIFFAVSDRDWVLDGANVHVSMVGFDGGAEQTRILDGAAVASINANLTSTADVTQARALAANLSLAFMGDTKGGAFDINEDVALEMLRQPNPHGRPNSDVIVPWVNGIDITRRPQNIFIIDFGLRATIENAAMYESPFRYAQESIFPAREKSRTTIQSWWLHERPRVDMRAAISPLPRFICTPRVSKHRLFVWLESPTLPDSATFVFAHEDDYFFGVLHSRLHEVWALKMGTRLEDRPRYTPTTTLETFPFPWPPGCEPKDDPRVEAIAQAARELVEKRNNWLNPPGADEATLKKRTLTNLYNERPTWLQNAHRTLDAAVLDAYGWPRDLGDEEILARLLALNLERASAGGSTASAAGGTDTQTE